MTLDFQINVLKYVFTTKEGNTYVKFLSKDMWDYPEHQLVFDLVQKYITKYTVFPTPVNLVEYFDIEYNKLKSKVDTATKKRIEETIKQLYTNDLGEDVEIVREELIKEAKRKLTRILFNENAGDNIDTGDDAFFDSLYDKMGEITSLGKDRGEEGQHGGLVLKSYSGMSVYKGQVMPTYLHGLNRMTTVGGFKSPEFIIFMTGPKGFKTGTVMNIGVEYMRDGVPVMYVDNENGADALKRRIYQKIGEFKYSDIIGDDPNVGRNLEVLDETIDRIKLMGGDMAVDSFYADVSTVNDVRNSILYYKNTYGFMPKVLIWDTPDKFRPIDHSIKEKRLRIQAVYNDIINLNKEFGLFSIGVSQISRSAIGNPVLDMTDFAEDIGKAANAHAAFGICRSEEEIKAGTARIIPVMQRDGIRYKGGTDLDTCFVEIDESRQLMKEFKEGSLYGVGMDDLEDD